MMDAKTVLGGKAARTIVDFASIVLSGIVLTRVLQIAWSLAGTSFIIGALPWMPFGALPGMIGVIIVGFLGGYFVKIFYPDWYWWEAIAPAGTVVIGCIVMIVVYIDLSTCIVLLDILLGFYFWNFACCDVHLRDLLAGRQESSGYPWLAEIVEALLVPTGVLLPFLVDAYADYNFMIAYLVVLACLCVLMIVSVKFRMPGSATSSSILVSLAGMGIRTRAKHFLDGKNIIRAVLLVFYMLLLEYYGFQAIQARQWLYSTPSLTLYYDIELYSITYYGILAGSIIAFLVVRLVFEYGRYRIASIETAIALAFLSPATFLLFLVIGDALNLAIPFMFCQAAFVGAAFELFITLLGHGLQVRMAPRSVNPS